MAQPNQPSINMIPNATYRDSYANSVQVKMSIWDFQLVFGTLTQDSAEEVNISNFQGVYISPQQAKALVSILAQNLQQYEQAFGEINLEQKSSSSSKPGPVVLPVPSTGGPVN